MRLWISWLYIEKKNEAYRCLLNVTLTYLCYIILSFKAAGIAFFLQLKIFEIFPIYTRNTDLGVLMRIQNLCFTTGRIRKNYVYPWKPHLSLYKAGCFMTLVVNKMIVLWVHRVDPVRQLGQAPAINKIRIIENFHLENMIPRALKR